MTILSKKEKKNTYLGLIAVFTWSFAALGAVGLTSIPAFEIMIFVFGIAFLVVVARFSMAENKESFLNFNKIDLLVASAALVINHVCYYLAFRYSPAAEVDLINYMWPTLLLLFSSFLPKERLCISSLLAGAICFWGLYILLCPDFSDGLTGECLVGYLYAFGAALSWTIYSLYTKYRRNNSSNCVSFACGVAAVFSLLIHLLFEEFVLPNSLEIVTMVLLGVFEVGLAYYFWDRAVKQGSVKVVGLASYSIPILSILLLVLFGFAQFQERMLLATLIISAAPLIPLVKGKVQLKFPYKKAKQQAPLKTYS